MSEIPVYALAAFVILAACLAWHAGSRVIAGYEAREKQYLAMIRGLENRIHAKDLSGYMTLQDSDKQREKPLGAPNPYPSGTDEALAYEYHQKNGTLEEFMRSLPGG